MSLLGPRPKSAIALLFAAAAFAFAPAALAYHEGDERITDETAHTLRARETRIGLWEIEFAPVAFLLVGTDTAPWAASILLHSVVENGHVKLQLLRTAPLTISVSAGVYHAAIPESGPVVTGSGSLLLFPASLYASSDLSRRVSLHLGVTYAHVDMDGHIDLDVGSSRTAIAASALQLHAAGEYRLSRVVALTLQLHGQPYSRAPAVRLSTTDASGDRIEFAGTVKPVERTAVAAIASIVLSGKYVSARIGGGYGAIFLPSMGIMIPYTTVLPEIDAYVRF